MYVCLYIYHVKKVYIGYYFDIITAPGTSWYRNSDIHVTLTENILQIFLNFMLVADRSIYHLRCKCAIAELFDPVKLVALVFDDKNCRFCDDCHCIAGWLIWVQRNEIQALFY